MPGGRLNLNWVGSGEPNRHSVQWLSTSDMVGAGGVDRVAAILAGVVACSIAGAVQDRFCDPFVAAPADPDADLRDCALADGITRVAFRCFQDRPLPTSTPASGVDLSTLDYNWDAEYVRIVLDMLDAGRGANASESRHSLQDALMKVIARYPSRREHALAWVIGTLLDDIERDRVPASSVGVAVDVALNTIPNFRVLLLKFALDKGSQPLVEVFMRSQEILGRPFPAAYLFHALRLSMRLIANEQHGIHRIAALLLARVGFGREAGQWLQGTLETRKACWNSVLQRTRPYKPTVPIDPASTSSVPTLIRQCH